MRFLSALCLLLVTACATAPAPVAALSARAEGGQKFEVTGNSDEDIYLMSYRLCRERHQSGFQIVRAPQPDVLKTYPGLQGVIRCAGKVDSELTQRYEHLKILTIEGPDTARVYYQRIPE